MRREGQQQSCPPRAQLEVPLTSTYGLWLGSRFLHPGPFMLPNSPPPAVDLSPKDNE